LWEVIKENIRLKQLNIILKKDKSDITNDEITQTTKYIDSVKDMLENIETTHINGI